MSSPYIGEIRLFAGNFPPVGWAFCDGQPTPISENDALFTLIGTTYGGDGEETFNLPNLQSRIPLHQGTSQAGTDRQIGETGGVEEVTLTVPQIPSHTHAFLCSTENGTTAIPTGAVIGSLASAQLFRPADDPNTPPTVAANAQSVTPAGGSQPHDNMHPFLCINYIISLFGIFPTQN